MKFAVYVEGQAEMLFVADVLQKYSGYESEKVGFTCINLVSDQPKSLPDPKQGDLASEHYYQIVNVNNDSGVISKLKQHIPNLLQQGFQIVIGLKDVYGKAYEQLCKNAIVDRKMVERLYVAQSQNFDVKQGDVRLHFAVMEYEAWMLALIGRYIEQKGGTIQEVEQNLSIDLSQDFEQTTYHLANKVKEVFEFLGKKYGKHEGDERSFLSSLTKDDYEVLRTSGRCVSFAKFLDSLFGNAKPPLP